MTVICLRVNVIHTLRRCAAQVFQQATLEAGPYAGYGKRAAINTILLCSKYIHVLYIFNILTMCIEKTYNLIIKFKKKLTKNHKSQQ